MQRVGSLNTRKVDVRVIAATNHDLRSAAAARQFREDFVLPAFDGGNRNTPLDGAQERPSFSLPAHFVARYARQYGKQISGITHRGARSGFPNMRGPVTLREPARM